MQLGILRLVLQSSVFAFVLLYQLWYTKGYQSFDIVASSVTTKVSIGYYPMQLSPLFMNYIKYSKRPDANVRNSKFILIKGKGALCF